MTGTPEEAFVKLIKVIDNNSLTKKQVTNYLYHVNLILTDNADKIEHNLKYQLYTLFKKDMEMRLKQMT